MEERIIALRDLIQTRLEAMDKAGEIFADNLNRVPTLLDRETARLEKLFEERFKGVQMQFAERETRATAAETAAKEATAALAVASTSAVSAALQAQKDSAFATQQSNTEAIRKSELGFTNEILALKTLINATKEALTDSVTELRSRMDRGEGSDRGHKEARTDSYANVGAISLAIGSVVGIIGIVITVLSVLPSHVNGSVPSPSAVASNPLVGPDTKRMDDLVSRMDALSSRINTLPLHQLTPQQLPPPSTPVK